MNATVVRKPTINAQVQASPMHVLQIHEGRETSVGGEAISIV
jgi:hypothetical protein